MNIDSGAPVHKVVYMKAPGDRALAEQRLAEYATAWGLTLNGIDESPRSVFDDNGALIGKQIRYDVHLVVVDPEKFMRQWDAAEQQGGES